MIFICERTAVPGKELNTKHARHEEIVSRKGKEHVDASGSQEFHFVQFTQRLIRTLRLNYALHITDLYCSNIIINSAINNCNDTDT